MWLFALEKKIWIAERGELEISSVCTGSYGKLRAGLPYFKDISVL